jgi:hypothetical protein
MYLPSGKAPSRTQLTWSIIASAVSGVLAYVQWNRSHADHRGGEVEHGRSIQEPSLFQLPAQVADFGDREEEQRSLADLMRLSGEKKGTPFPVVIFGPSGVGKTTLALRVAHTRSGRYPDGRMYVDLRGSEDQPLDSSDVLFGLLRDVGLSGDAIPQGMEERGRLFRAKLTNRRVILVLDNAGSEAQVRPLLPGRTGCAVLITSRGPPRA